MYEDKNQAIDEKAAVTDEKPTVTAVPGSSEGGDTTQKTEEKSTVVVPAPETVPGGGTTQKTEVTTRTTAPVSTGMPAGYRMDGYEDVEKYLRRAMDEHKPLTEEELKKLRRRQKAEGIISGISDAVQSVANLVFANQYAPNMYDAKEGMSAKAKARFEKEKAKREADNDKYLNYALTLGKLRDAENANALAVAKNAREEAKEAREAEMHKLEIQFKNNQIDAAQYDAQRKEVEAKYAEQLQQSLIDKNTAAAGASKASAANSYASAAAHRRSNEKEFYAKDSKGKLHSFKSKEAAETFARQNGTWVETEEEEVTTTDAKNPYNSKTVIKEKKGGYPKLEEEASGIPMPGVKKQ